MVESTRWLFCLLALVSLVLGLPAALGAADGAMLFVALGSAVVLGLSWGTGYARRSSPLSMDVVDAVATLGLALACPSPIAVLGFVFGALWFRSLYGSTWRAVLRCGLFVAALSAALPLWSQVPGHVGGTEAPPVLGVFPIMFLTVIVGRHLAGNVRARERAAQLDAVHATLGARLLGITDATEIRRIAWTAVAGVCAAVPGLRVLKLVRDGWVLRVDGATGGFVGIPATLPATVLSNLNAAAGSIADMPDRYAELDAAVGEPCAWACVPLPNGHQQHGNAWLVVGSPRHDLAEAVVSIGSLANQVTLALQNSEVHAELTVQATLDNLTGLPNRPLFNAALSAAIEDTNARPTTVLFVDLDDFKDVNDKLGHGAGDELLCEIAARLQRAIRPHDLCARLGGDEFAVLLRNTDGVAASLVAQRIVDSVAAPVHLGRGPAAVGASVGVATATDDIDASS
jgi:diguanylate cyclase (GGDEF)-like protein